MKMNQEMSNSSARSLKADKGVAGLTILLSVVAMVFIIGFLVMIFAIIGSNLSDNASTATSVTVNGEQGFANTTGYTVAGATADGFRSFVITGARNSSNLTQVYPLGNFSYTQAGVVKNATALVLPAVNFNYTYVENGNNTATESIDDTTNAIAGVTQWFPIIITITVMVALILLTVIIIVAIRSSGILAGGN